MSFCGEAIGTRRDAWTGFGLAGSSGFPSICCVASCLYELSNHGLNAGTVLGMGYGRCRMDEMCMCLCSFSDGDGLLAATSAIDQILGLLESLAVGDA